MRFSFHTQYNFRDYLKLLCKGIVMPYRLQGQGSAYYRIYGEKDGMTKEYHHDIAFDELGDVLDSMIEIGGMSKEEYQAKVKDFICSL